MCKAKVAQFQIGYPYDLTPLKTQKPMEKKFWLKLFKGHPKYYRVLLFVVHTARGGRLFLIGEDTIH